MKTYSTFGLKLLLFLLATTSTIIGHSQNYQPIKSNFQHFYMAESGSFNGIRIDSFALENADSVFYNYKTLRLDSTIYCYNPNSPSWIGSKVISRPNGDNLFFNKTNDTIWLKQYALQGEEWTVMKLFAGKRIVGRIDTIMEESILGSLDSVKVISLKKIDANGNTMSSSINGKYFKIGKQSGLVCSLDIYNFPNYAIEYNLVGNQNQQAGLYFHGQEEYNIGDVFHRSSSSTDDYSFGSSCQGGFHSTDEYLISTIVNKEVFPDSVKYYFHTIRGYYTNTCCLPGIPSPPSNTYNYNEYDNVKIVALPLPNSNYIFPEEFISSNSSDYMAEGILYHVKLGCNNRFIVSSHYGDSDIYEDYEQTGCFQMQSHLSPNCYGSHYSLDGIGNYSNYSNCGDYCFNGSYSNGYEYFKIGNEECGTPISQSIILALKEKTLNSFNIYPNPANTTIKVNTQSDRFTLNDLSGKTLLTIKLNKGQADVDVSNLDNGIYFLQSDKGKTQKLLIQH